MAHGAHIERRSPEKVMRLGRLGSFHQCRLGFMRILTRRMAREKWEFSRPAFDIDDKGVGHAVYSAKVRGRHYSLVAFAHDLPDSRRSDRVIAEAWDATFALHDGIPGPDDIDRLARNVPLQEAGRVSESELTLSRANRSVRLWDHVVHALASGKQPDPEKIDSVGYLMRTTAVYGSGKFGAADRERIADRDEMQAPFQAEMLSVYMIRVFVRDLVRHIAKIGGGEKAIDLDPDIARRMGIGNSTGLGMAPFIVNHPVLFNNWIMVREEAIRRVRSVETATEAEQTEFRRILSQAARLIENGRSDHPVQVSKLAELRHDMKVLQEKINSERLDGRRPWNGLFEWAESSLGEEGQEFLASILLEPYGNLVDGLAVCMADKHQAKFQIDGSKSVGETKGLIRDRFSWALDIDWNSRENCARAWYVSEEKLEPRLGERFEEPIADYEQPLAPARDACMALSAMAKWEDGTSIAKFLSVHPEHRHAIRRVQMCRAAPYGEICDNTIGAGLMPIDMLRAKLSFFGATRFDPRSDRWVRICMYAGAPYPEEITSQNSDLWVYGGMESESVA